MAEIDKETLIQKRGRIKAKITRIETYINQNENNVNIDINEFVIRETMLVKSYEDYDNIQDRLESLEADQEQDRVSVEVQYTSLHSKLKTIIQRRSGNINATQSRSSNEVAPSTASTYQVKLPNINIPIFSGKYEDYRPFIELFNALIHSDTHLNRVQKLLYLKTVLRDEPLSMVNELPITDANYDVALDLLQKRYDIKLVTINCHIRGLMDAQVTKGNQSALRDFIVKIKQHYNALAALEVPVQHWDLILVHIMSSRLDFHTHRVYELERDPLVLPTFKTFVNFLEKRCLALETLAPESKQKITAKSYHLVSDGNTSNTGKCLCCDLNYHPIYRCNKFGKFTLVQKRDFVMKNRLCFNCLGSKHTVAQCKSDGCRVCNGKHHTVLHEDKGRGNLGSQRHLGNTKVNENEQAKIAPLPLSPSSLVTTPFEANSTQEKSCLMSNTNKQILLATALVNLITYNGCKLEARALLDSGSQSSFITAAMASKLRAKVRATNIQISGLGQSGVRVSNTITISCESQREPKKNISVVCGILNKITCPLPHAYVDSKELNIPDDLSLADRTFYIPGEIDLLLGADVYYDIIQSGILRLGENCPVLQNSLFGWIVGGNVSSPSNHCSNLSVSLFSNSPNLEVLIPQFWRLEEVSNTRHMSPEDQISEKIYKDTTKRLESGVFEVRLPIKPDMDISQLGNSLSKATQRFLSLEKRFHKDPKLKVEYKAFIDEYLALGHATYVEPNENIILTNRYILPHHCVVREDKLTTRYRVVFDGSMKTTSGLSLNDIMLKGSRVQPELFDIIARFRTFRYVLTSDIQKMYRQIRVNPRDRILQNILWRDDPSLPLRCIELQTVTYGTNCAPFLATRTLNDLANQGQGSFPLAADTLLRQTYVDDVLGGTDTLPDLLQLQGELTELLKSGGFELHKWNSNVRTMFKWFQNETEFHFQPEGSISKVLGISWNPTVDCFQISIPKVLEKRVFTKREVLGIIAQVFDPMGFVGPVIIIAKVIMQKLWSLKLEWDDALPPDLLLEWLKFYKGLPELTKLTLPRWIFMSGTITSIQLIGFSDASMTAYGGCLYVRALYDDGTVSCCLVCSKSRVAPLKTVSLPRLELCGFLLLARMCHKFSSCMKFQFKKVVMFTDSQIVLAWLQSTPSRWTTFVANRVAEIQELSDNTEWRHVSSADNPADYISRGLDPVALIQCKAWWSGPEFLKDCKWQSTKAEGLTIKACSIPEQKQVSHVQVKAEKNQSIFRRFSSFVRLQRSIAWVFRFINNAKGNSQKIHGPLSVEELNKALVCIFKVAQTEHFTEDISSLEKEQVVSKRSSLLTLHPFLDSQGLLRVGGRLVNASLSFDAKYPVILPSYCHVTDLLIEYEHRYLGHAGPQSILNSLRQRVWPINALRRIKYILLKCVKCHRFKAAMSKQLMGSLPVERVQLIRPFFNVGIDFGGPIMVKESRLRKSIVSKAYIALFVCMATKAVHIELVSNLSTEAFLLSLKRFTARRGNPSSISSDNATNFKGANNSLHEVHLLFQRHSNEIQEFLSVRNINWKFIPPNSPHWGGLWEAGIKGTKYHLKRILGNSTLSFECLTTVLAQIEAILNSRPLQPLSNVISDLTCLTPGHFLIGQPLTAFPEKTVLDIPDHRLNLWQHCSKLRQDFWRKWSHDYLNQLQHRPKWKTSEHNLEIGHLVLVKEDNLPPLEWCLARIIDVMPGPDKRVRVVKIRTNKGEFVRPITKLCPLPFQETNSDFVEDNASRGGEC